MNEVKIGIPHLQNKSYHVFHEKSKNINGMNRLHPSAEVQGELPQALWTGNDTMLAILAIKTLIDGRFLW